MNRIEQKKEIAQDAYYGEVFVLRDSQNQISLQASKSFDNKILYELETVSALRLPGLMYLSDMNRSQTRMLLRGYHGKSLRTILPNLNNSYDVWMILTLCANLLKRLECNGLSSRMVLDDPDFIYYDQKERMLYMLYYPGLSFWSQFDWNRFLNSLCQILLQHTWFSITPQIAALANRAYLDTDAILFFVQSAQPDIVKNVENRFGAGRMHPAAKKNYSASDGSDISEGEEKILMLHSVRSNEVISVHQPLFILGSHPDMSDYCIHNRTVSRRHARIRYDGTYFYVTDLRSRNRTCLNGKVIGPDLEVQLYQNDILCLSNEAYQVKILPAAAFG